MNKVLLCLDPDPQPSVFDSVVAIDAGVDHLLRHGGVTPEEVPELVHGTLFTRRPADLNCTAIFIGGSDVNAAEALLAATARCFFGPMRASVLMDPHGANTTAAAAVLAAGRHVPLAAESSATVLGTGPVGQRVTHLLASEGVPVTLCSRNLVRATELCNALGDHVQRSLLTPATTSDRPIADVLTDTQILISCGPAGVEMVNSRALAESEKLRVIIDLNAVPPLGVAGIDVTDKAVVRGNQVHYGAVGIGGTKMKIHTAAIRRLFESNTAVLDASEVYQLGKRIEP